MYGNALYFLFNCSIKLKDKCTYSSSVNPKMNTCKIHAHTPPGTSLSNFSKLKIKWKSQKPKKRHYIHRNDLNEHWLFRNNEGKLLLLLHKFPFMSFFLVFYNLRKHFRVESSSGEIWETYKRVYVYVCVKTKIKARISPFLTSRLFPWCSQTVKLAGIRLILN